MADTIYNDYLDNPSKKTENFLPQLDIDRNNKIDANQSIFYNYRWLDPVSQTDQLLNKRMGIVGWESIFKNNPESTPITSIETGEGFDYEGNYLKGIGQGGTGNFFFSIPTENLIDSKNWNNDGTLYIRIPVRCSNSARLGLRIYSKYLDYSEISLIPVNRHTFTADEEQHTFSVDLDVSAIAKTNNGFDLDAINLRFFADAVDDIPDNTAVKFGQVYMGDVVPQSNQLENDADRYKYLARRVQSKNIVTDFINTVGDSLTARGYGTVLAENLNRSEKRFSYGGETSAQIRDHFLADGTAFYKNATVFWLGRNDAATQNPNYIKNILDSIKALGHSRYVVLSLLNGRDGSEYVGASRYYWFEESFHKLQNIFGSHVINIREELFFKYNYGDVKLAASFTQPLVGANVQITVNDTSFFDPTGDTTNLSGGMAIGFRDQKADVVINSAGTGYKAGDILVASGMVGVTITVTSVDTGGEILSAIVNELYADKLEVSSWVGGSGIGASIATVAPVDRYTIISIDSSTQMTIQLTESNRIAVAGTVENIPNNGGDTGLLAYDYLDIMDADDYLDLTRGVYAGTLREEADFIHYNDIGDELIGGIVADKMQILDI